MGRDGHRFTESVDVLEFKCTGDGAQGVDTRARTGFDSLDGAGCRLGELRQRLLRPVAKFSQIPDYPPQFGFAQSACFSGVKGAHIVSPATWLM